MTRFSRLTEAQIRKAEAEGQFRDLPGAGKPLPTRAGEAMLDAGEAAGFRMMAEAGALPEEIRLKIALDAALKDWHRATDDAARKTAMARIADLQMRYEIARDARRKFLR